MKRKSGLTRQLFWNDQLITVSRIVCGRLEAILSQLGGLRFKSIQHVLQFRVISKDSEDEEKIKRPKLPGTRSAELTDMKDVAREDGQPSRRCACH